MTVTLDEVRARGIAISDDDDVAQDIIDEQEAWLARRIGPLDGEIIQTFYIRSWDDHGKLYLQRYTDAVEVTDNEVAVDEADIRLVDDGSAIRRRETNYWAGPFVKVTYTPNDLLEVRRVLFDLIAMSVDPATPYESEQIGSYSYRRGKGSLQASRGALASSLLPKRAPALTVQAQPHLRRVAP